MSDEKPRTERVLAELRGYSTRKGASEYEHEVYGRAADTIAAQAAEIERKDAEIGRLREDSAGVGINAELIAENERLRGAIAYALGRLDPDSGGVPADLASALRMLADERAAWIEVAIAHNRGCAAEIERKDALLREERQRKCWLLNADKGQILTAQSFCTEASADAHIDAALAGEEGGE